MFVFFRTEGVPKGTVRHVAIPQTRSLAGLLLGGLIFKRLEKQAVAQCWARSPAIFGGPLAPQCRAENGTDSKRHLISPHEPLHGASIPTLQIVKETQATDVK